MTKPKHNPLETMDREAARKKAKAAKGRVSNIDRLKDATLKEFRGKRGPYIAARIADMPAVKRNSYLRAMRGKSLRSAVTAFCSECVQWVQGEVSACEAFACALHPYRPKRA